MRRLFVAFGLMGGLLSPAFAADYDLPVLRGSEPVAPVMTVGPATFTRWSGFYFGGQFGYSGETTTFPQGVSLLPGSFPGQTPTPSVQLLSNTNGSAVGAIGYGGFVGYNTQWQDLILGVEANYTHTNLTPSSSSATSIHLAGIIPTATVTENGSLDLTDYGSLRGRAGWVLGNFLPYGFVGFVVGQATRGASYSVTPTTVCVPCSNSASGNTVLYGFSAGGGLDWALTQNVFLRGEFEFIQFNPTANVTVSTFGARVGAGFKF
jgi:outer membrane immunogenic protein